MLDAHELKLKNINNNIKKNIEIRNYTALKQNELPESIKKLKQSIVPVIIMVCICAAVGVLLGIIGSITKPVIEQRNIEAGQNARISVLPLADSLKEINFDALIQYQSINKILDEKDEISQSTDTLKKRIKGIYEAYKGQEKIGWVIEVTSKGYGGDINLTIGIYNNLQISAVRPGQNFETPGLGSKVLSKEFVSKLEGLQIKDKDFAAVKSAKTSETEIQAVSGATITSKAVVQALNDAAKIARALSQIPALEKGVN